MALKLQWYGKILWSQQRDGSENEQCI